MYVSSRYSSLLVSRRETLSLPPLGLTLSLRSETDSLPLLCPRTPLSTPPASGVSLDLLGHHTHNRNHAYGLDRRPPPVTNSPLVATDHLVSFSLSSLLPSVQRTSFSIIAHPNPNTSSIIHDDQRRDHSGPPSLNSQRHYRPPACVIITLPSRVIASSVATNNACLLLESTLLLWTISLSPLPFTRRAYSLRRLLCIRLANLG